MSHCLRRCLKPVRAVRGARSPCSVCFRLAWHTDTDSCCLQVISLSIDFYVRVFVRVYTSAEKVKDSASKQMYVFQSSGCDSFFTQPVGRKVNPSEHFPP